MGRGGGLSFLVRVDNCVCCALQGEGGGRELFTAAETPVKPRGGGGDLFPDRLLRAQCFLLKT